MRAIGDEVQLHYDCGSGSIRGGLFFDHGATVDGFLPIVGLKENPSHIIKPYDYTIQFPDGYRMGIDEKDIRR